MSERLSTEARLASDPLMEERHYSSGAMSNQLALQSGQAMVTTETEREYHKKVLGKEKETSSQRRGKDSWLRLQVSQDGHRWTCSTRDERFSEKEEGIHAAT